MKKLLIYCLFSLVYHIASSQTISIQNQETGEPMEGVTLSSETPNAFTITDAQGKADISNFQDAEKIQIRTLGYKVQNKSYQELEAASFRVELMISSFNLDDIVVSASRWNEPSGQIPSKIMSISPKEIALQNPQTAADLLGISGAVFIQKSQQGGGSPIIRGFATNRLLYTVDGVRMNNAIFRGGNIQNVISLDPFAMENVEVFFGPGSIIYGSDAIGGVMSFQTLTPQFSTMEKPFIKGKAVTRYASANDEKTGHFDLNVGWKKWAWISSISTNDFDDLKMGSDGPEEYLRPFYVQRIDSMDVVVNNDDPKIQRPSAYSQINMMQKVRFMPNEKWDFQYGFHYSETSDYARYDRHIRYRKGSPRYGEWSYGPQKWRMNNLNVTHSGKNRIYDQATLRLAQQFFEESRISRDFNDPNREVRTEQVDAYSINLDFLKNTSFNNKLLYGVEVVWNNITSTGMNENIETGKKLPGATRYPQSTWASYGIYLSDQFHVSDQLLLQAGIRYNQFQLDAKFDTTFYAFPFTTAQIDNGALTGSVGFVYRPTEDWVVSANAATAFRSPNVDDVGKVFDSEPGSVVVPNPNLKAEYAYNIDLSIAKVFGNIAKIDLTGYYTILQNALVRRDYTLNGQSNIVYDGTLSQVQAIQNAAVANVYGVQAGIEIILPKGFGFSSDYSYQVGEEELDDGDSSPSRHAVPGFGVSRITYKMDKLMMQIYATYSAEKKFEDLPEEEKGKAFIYAIDENGNPYAPSWYTFNFKAMYQFAENFTISAGLENLTDQRYRPYSSGITAAGRNIILSLQCNF